MKLEDIFISKVKNGGTRILLRKKYFYDVDRFVYVYMDIKSKECFSSLDLRGEFKPFTLYYNNNKKKNLGKRRVLKFYNEHINKFN